MGLYTPVLKIIELNLLTIWKLQNYSLRFESGVKLIVHKYFKYQVVFLLSCKEMLVKWEKFHFIQKMF